MGEGHYYLMIDQQEIISKVCNSIFWLNREYTIADLKNRCLEGIWRFSKENPNLLQNKGLFFQSLKNFVLKDVLKEKGILNRSGTYIPKMSFISIVNDIPYEKKESFLSLIETGFKISKLSEIGIAILTLYYDLDTSKKFFKKYVEILNREPGCWSFLQIAIYFRKDPKRIKAIYANSIKKLREYMI